MSDPIRVKLVIIGDGAIGKTCILVSFAQNKFPREYIPTVFENSTATLKIDNKIVNLGLWDTAGQEEYAKLRPLAYSNTDVFLIAFSVVERSSFINVIKKWIPEIRQAMPTSEVIIVGNKTDIRDGEPVSTSFIYEKEARQALKATNYTYLECSALTRKGLKEVFETAVKQVINKRPRDSVSNDSSGSSNCNCDCQLI